MLVTRDIVFNNNIKVVIQMHSFQFDQNRKLKDLKIWICCFHISFLLTSISNVFNPICTGGRVNIDPPPFRFLCSYFDCVKAIDIIFIDFSSVGITHILILKLLVYFFCNHSNFLVNMILKSF